MIAVMLMLFACSDPAPVDPSSPVAVGDQVAMRLTEAALLRQQGDAEGAEEAWREAHDTFEQVLEGPLRTGCGERCTTELEYGFGRVRHALEANQRDVVAVADALGVKIQGAAATLSRSAIEEDP